MNKILMTTLLLGLFSTSLWAQGQGKVASQYATSSQVHLLAQQLKRLERRMARIEKLLNNKILAETVERIDDMQSEIRELRGEVEDIGYKVDSASRRNKNLYLDTDRRLQELERQRNRPLVQAAPVVTVEQPAAPQAKAEQKPVQTSSQTAKAVVLPKKQPMADNKVANAEKAAMQKPPQAQKKQPPVPVSISRSPALNAQERQDYIKAFNYLKHGRYKKSLLAFRDFLEKYPNGRYADNAQYWLAESNYVSRFFDKAIKEFNKVIELYPSSPKVADARLKIAYCYYEKGQWQQARQAFQSVMRDYKGTSVARLAERRLKKLKREGR